jgi:hypothetical protein
VRGKCQKYSNLQLLFQLRFCLCYDIKNRKANEDEAKTSTLLMFLLSFVLMASFEAEERKVYEHCETFQLEMCNVDGIQDFSPLISSFGL